jgi:hypothetical protein
MVRHTDEPRDPPASSCLWCSQPKDDTVRLMSMVGLRATRMVAACVAVCVLTSCGSEPESTSRNISSERGQAETATVQDDTMQELASEADSYASDIPTRLRIVNNTTHEVVLTSATTSSTIAIAAGGSTKLASERVCRWLPLTAATASGDVLETYSEPCDGQTWTIGAPSPSDAGGAYSVAVADDVPRADGAVASRFIAFASGPTTELSSQVPFDPSGVTLTFGTSTLHLARTNLGDEAAWLLSYGAGSTSALHVIRHSLSNARGEQVEFAATRTPLPLCDDGADVVEKAALNRVFLAVPDAAGSCAVGYRVTFDLTSHGAIRAVGIAVREP